MFSCPSPASPQSLNIVSFSISGSPAPDLALKSAFSVISGLFSPSPVLGAASTCSSPQFCSSPLILFLQISFTSSILAMRSSLLFTSYALSMLEATASRNIETVMLIPTEFELFPVTTGLDLFPSLWSFSIRVITARDWSWVTRLSCILPPCSCASPWPSILFHIAA